MSSQQQRLNSSPLNCYDVTMTMVIMRSTINEELQLQIKLAECLLLLPLNFEDYST